MILAAFLLYLAILIGIGVWAARVSTAGMDEFFLGGRRMKDWVVALSAVVSGRSAWLILGVSGAAYLTGLAAVWVLPGYILMELGLFAFVGKRLRRATARQGDLTLPDFFESRFADRTRLLRVLAVVIIFCFVATYVSAQFLAGGKAFAATFDLSPERGILLTAGIVLAYTMLGGFFAVTYTDVVQAACMLLSLVALPALAVWHCGGPGAMLARLEGLDPALVDPWATGLLGVVNGIGIGLGSPGNPHIVTRYMAVDDPRRLRRAALVGTAWNVVLGWGALLAGLAGRALFPTLDRLPGGDKERLFPLLAGEFLPTFLCGMVIASILAAIMSTADSQLLVAASGVSRDLYQRLPARGARATERQLVLLSRGVIAVLVVLAVAPLLLGGAVQELVFWFVLFAWAGLGAAFGPALLFALFWSRTTRTGVAAGMLVGAGVTILWKTVPALKGLMYELVPAFGLSALAIWLVSLATEPPAGAAGLVGALRPRYRPRRPASLVRDIPVDPAP